jgi:SAM-dependent methyltransferase
VEPEDIFWSTHYTRHNQRRQEHLASLGLQLADRTVLEVGAGIGDHTSFFLDRRCNVVVTEAQEQNLTVLRDRYPDLDVRRLDLNMPPEDAIEVDVVYCYGTLYHLDDPAAAIEWMSRCSREMLLIETCVAYGQAEAVYPFQERAGKPDDALSGTGCRPTRSWVRSRLAACFEHVYVPVSQPWHEEFPVDWSRPELADESLIRAVFVASKKALSSDLLTEELPMRQVRL